MNGGHGQETTVFRYYSVKRVLFKDQVLKDRITVRNEMVSGQETTFLCHYSVKRIL